jgi:RNA polymerase sigma factor (sigma-70 family)
MSNRYERFNEITFNAYCMTAINNAVKRGLRKKRLRAQHEIPLDVLDENLNVTFDLPDNCLPAQDMAADIFEINGLEIPVMNEDLANALRLIPPQRRNIVLLSYLIGKNDVEIGKMLNLARTTVRDRRHDGVESLQTLMRGKE